MLKIPGEGVFASIREHKIHENIMNKKDETLIWSMYAVTAMGDERPFNPRRLYPVVMQEDMDGEGHLNCLIGGKLCTIFSKYAYEHLTPIRQNGYGIYYSVDEDINTVHPDEGDMMEYLDRGYDDDDEFDFNDMANDFWESMDNEVINISHINTNATFYYAMFGVSVIDFKEGDFINELNSG